MKNFEKINELETQVADYRSDIVTIEEKIDTIKKEIADLKHIGIELSYVSLQCMLEQDKFKLADKNNALFISENTFYIFKNTFQNDDFIKLLDSIDEFNYIDICKIDMIKKLLKPWYIIKRDDFTFYISFI